MTLRMAGFIIEKSRDSLRSLPREGVSSNLDHRSTNGRLVSSQAKEREREREAVSFASAGHQQQLHGGNFTDDEQSTVAQTQSGDAVHDSAKQRY
jgi:hypothetical protein